MNVEEVFAIIKEALEKTGSAIIENWESFSILLIFYTLLVFAIFKTYYKHKSEHLSDWQANLERDEKRIKSELNNIETLQKENEYMRIQLGSDEYQAFLLSRNKHSEDLTDSDMFGKK